jgi:hypothetical protein
MSAAKNASIDETTSSINSQATPNQSLKRRCLCTGIDCEKNYACTQHKEASVGMLGRAAATEPSGNGAAIGILYPS